MSTQAPVIPSERTAVCMHESTSRTLVHMHMLHCMCTLQPIMTHFPSQHKLRVQQGQVSLNVTSWFLNSPIEL